MLKKRLFPLLFGCTIIMLACDAQNGRSRSSKKELSGEEIYKKFCIACHGSNGRLAFNGAKDLTASKLSLEERVLLVKKGKGLMTPFESMLTETEIARVAQFTLLFNTDLK